MAIVSVAALCRPLVPNSAVFNDRSWWAWHMNICVKTASAWSVTSCYIAFRSSVVNARFTSEKLARQDEGALRKNNKNDNNNTTNNKINNNEAPVAISEHLRKMDAAYHAGSSAIAMTTYINILRVRRLIWGVAGITSVIMPVSTSRSLVP